MRLLLVHLLSVSLLFIGCDAFFIGFVSNPGGTMSVSGTVTIVQLGSIQKNPNAAITFTAVTFVNSGTAITINFCGDQHSQFPLGQLVRANFNTGFSCSTLLVVVITP